MQFNEMINKVIQGNVIDVLKRIPSESIDTVITSPPYWSLRNYGIRKGWFKQKMQ